MSIRYVDPTPIREVNPCSQSAGPPEMPICFVNPRCQTVMPIREAVRAARPLPLIRGAAPDATP